MNVSDLKHEEWVELVEKINGESCILLLGPNLYKTADGQVLQDILYTKLKNKFKGELFDFFSEDGFFIPINENIVNDMRWIVKNFYKKISPDETLKKIAQIPFHCLVALTPDMLLKQTFEKYDVDKSFERFSMTERVNNQLPKPAKNKPLIYNLFGSIDEDDTIILTHDHFFTYLKNIMGDDRLPAPLKVAINKATDLIFLGFTFEKWWMQLLMRLLGLHAFKGSKRWAVEKSEDNSFFKISEKQFKITVIEDNADVFIEELYKKAISEKCQLRTLNQSEKEAKATEVEIRNKRILELKKQIEKAMDLRNGYEKKKMLTDDPKEEEKCNDEIAKLNLEIKEKSAELKSFKK